MKTAKTSSDALTGAPKPCPFSSPGAREDQRISDPPFASTSEPVQ